MGEAEGHPAADKQLGVAAAADDHLCSLGHAERLIVDGVRLWTVAPERWVETVLAFNRALGPCLATAAAGALGSLIARLAQRARRPLVLRPPGCPRLSPDERCLIDLVAAAQRGDDARTRARLRWLVRGDAPGVAAAAANLGEAFGAAGNRLALAPAAAPERPKIPVLVTP